VNRNGELTDDNPTMDPICFVFGWVVSGFVYAFKDIDVRNTCYEEVMSEPFTDIPRQPVQPPKPKCPVCKLEKQQLEKGKCCDECQAEALAEQAEVARLAIEKLKLNQAKKDELEIYEAMSNGELATILIDKQTTKTLKNKIKKILQSRVKSD
jgi:hypothetical protein